MSDQPEDTPSPEMVRVVDHLTNKHVEDGRAHMMTNAQKAADWNNMADMFSHSQSENIALRAEVERLKALLPPDARGRGYVGQGSWSVFAEKVVAERDALKAEVERLTKERDQMEHGKGNAALRAEREACAVEIENIDKDTYGDGPRAMADYLRAKETP